MADELKPALWVYERAAPFPARYIHEERTKAYLTDGEGWTETKFVPEQVWRDIASAPRDGTKVLICGGTFGDDTSLGGPYPFDGVSIAHWTGIDFPGDMPWEGNPCHSHDDYRRHLPTHWQPLPSPPSAEG